MFNKPEYFYQAILMTLTIIVSFAIVSSIDVFKSEIKVKKFDEGMKMESKNLDELNFDQLEITSNNSGPVKNIVQNESDNRDYSFNNYSQDIDVGNASENAAKEFEKSLWENAEGNEIRKSMQEAFENNSVNTVEIQKKVNVLATNQNQFSGSVMVRFKVGVDRSAFQNNNWYVRNPGYTCGVGNGIVVVNVKVGQDGFVRKAAINQSQTTTTNSCMLDNALEYAYKSRFSIDSNVPKEEEGYIIYEFISQ